MSLLPPRIARLPQDSRGYPVPWNVLIGRDGKAIFTANDERKHLTALLKDLCPICGGSNEEVRWFVGGPRSAFSEHGAYIDLPGHEECEEFALRRCPWLSAPRYLRRIDIVDPDNVPDEVLGFVDPTQIPDRPDPFVSVGARRTKIIIGSSPMPYVRPIDVVEYRFWRRGERLSGEEALPALRAIFGEGWNIPKISR